MIRTMFIPVLGVPTAVGGEMNMIHRHGGIVMSRLE